jgi:hypothetical protein
MLDPWIIEEIRKREEQERLREDRRPGLEIPVQPPQHNDRERDRKPEEERGVVIINFFTS